MSSLGLYVMVVISWFDPEGITLMNDALIFNTIEQCQEFQGMQAVDALSYVPADKILAGKFKVLCVKAQVWGYME